MRSGRDSSDSRLILLPSQRQPVLLAGMRYAIALVTVLLLAGCASVTHIVTGSVRPAIDPALVRVFPQPPSGSEEIAQLQIEGGDGQHGLDKSIQQLKEAAAQMGANGLVIMARSARTTGAVALSPTLAVPVHVNVVDARAIYVP